MKLKTISKEEIIKSILNGEEKEIYYVLRVCRRKRAYIDGVYDENAPKDIVSMTMKPIENINLKKLVSLDEDENSCFVEIE